MEWSTPLVYVVGLLMRLRLCTFLLPSLYLSNGNWSSYEYHHFSSIYVCTTFIPGVQVLFSVHSSTQMVINEVMKPSCNFNKLEQRMRSLYSCFSCFFPLVLFSWVSVAVLSTSANDILLRIAPRTLTPNMRIVLALDFFLFFLRKVGRGWGNLLRLRFFHLFVGWSQSIFQYCDGRFYSNNHALCEVQAWPDLLYRAQAKDVACKELKQQQQK